MKNFPGRIFLLIILFILPDYLWGGYNAVTNCRFTASVFVRTKAGGFQHSPISKINILHDQIVLKINLTGTSKYTNVVLYYRKTGKADFLRISFMPKIKTNINSYEGIAIIPADEVTSEGIEYYIESESASSAVEKWSFKTSSAPQKIVYNEKERLVYNKNNNSIVLSDGNIYDGECKLKINNYEKDGNITFYQLNDVEKLPDNNSKNVISKKPVIAYKIEPAYKVLSQASKLTLLYFDINQDGREDISAKSEALLKIYWYDGFDWRFLGGDVDSVNNIISLNLYNFGILGVFPVYSTDIEDFRPKEHILTLDNNGQNDFLIFSGLSGEYEIKIIDISGRLIKLITDRPYWDGKDMNSNYVASGVYMYQLKVKDKIIKGIFVIAK